MWTLESKAHGNDALNNKTHEHDNNESECAMKNQINAENVNATISISVLHQKKMMTQLSVTMTNVPKVSQLKKLCMQQQPKTKDNNDKDNDHNGEQEINDIEDDDNDNENHQPWKIKSKQTTASMSATASELSQ